jgi:DNA polymerase III alpha subunit
MLTTNDHDKIITGILNHGPDIIENVLADDLGPALEKYLERCQVERLDYPTPLEAIPSKRNWFIPKEYQEMNIEEFLVSQCPEENYKRLLTEIELYRKHDMIDVLKAMKYMVDVLKSNNVVWGVGRGSSVSSYCLYLIGIHKIDSVKYDLPITDFFKGDENG